MLQLFIFFVFSLCSDSQEQSSSIRSHTVNDNQNSHMNIQKPKKRFHDRYLNENSYFSEELDSSALESQKKDVINPQSSIVEQQEINSTKTDISSSKEFQSRSIYKYNPEDAKLLIKWYLDVFESSFAILQNLDPEIILVEIHRKFLDFLNKVEERAPETIAYYTAIDENYKKLFYEFKNYVIREYVQNKQPQSRDLLQSSIVMSSTSSKPDISLNEAMTNEKRNFNDKIEDFMTKKLKTNLPEKKSYDSYSLSSAQGNSSEILPNTFATMNYNKISDFQAHNDKSSVNETNKSKIQNFIENFDFGLKKSTDIDNQAIQVCGPDGARLFEIPLDSLTLHENISSPEKQNITTNPLGAQASDEFGSRIENKSNTDGFVQSIIASQIEILDNSIKGWKEFENHESALAKAKSTIQKKNVGKSLTANKYKYGNDEGASTSKQSKRHDPEINTQEASNTPIFEAVDVNNPRLVMIRRIKPTVSLSISFLLEKDCCKFTAIVSLDVKTWDINKDSAELKKIISQEYLLAKKFAKEQICKDKDDNLMFYSVTREFVTKMNRGTPCVLIGPEKITNEARIEFIFEPRVPKLRGIKILRQENGIKILRDVTQQMVDDAYEKMEQMIIKAVKNVKFIAEPDGHISQMIRKNEKVSPETRNSREKERSLPKKVLLQEHFRSSINDCATTSEEAQNRDCSAKSMPILTNDGSENLEPKMPIQTQKDLKETPSQISSKNKKRKMPGLIPLSVTAAIESSNEDSKTEMMEKVQNSTDIVEDQSVCNTHLQKRFRESVNVLDLSASSAYKVSDSYTLLDPLRNQESLPNSENQTISP